MAPRRSRAQGGASQATPTPEPVRASPRAPRTPQEKVDPAHEKTEPRRRCADRRAPRRAAGWAGALRGSGRRPRQGRPRRRLRLQRGRLEGHEVRRRVRPQERRGRAGRAAGQGPLRAGRALQRPQLVADRAPQLLAEPRPRHDARGLGEAARRLRAPGRHHQAGARPRRLCAARRDPAGGRGPGGHPAQGAQGRAGRDGAPGQVDPPGGDLRPRTPAPVRQRHRGRLGAVRRAPPALRGPPADRRERGRRRLVQGGHRRGAHLPARPQPEGDPPRHAPPRGAAAGDRAGAGPAGAGDRARPVLLRHRLDPRGRAHRRRPPRRRADHAHPLRDRHADLEHARVRRPRRPPGRRGDPAGGLQRPDRDLRGGARAGRVGARVRARRHLLERALRRRLRRALHRVRQRDQLRAPGHGRPGRRVRAAGQGGDRRHQGRQPARRPPGAGRRRQHQPEPVGARHARRGAEPRQPGGRLDRPPLRPALAVGAAHRPADLADGGRRLAPAADLHDRVGHLHRRRPQPVGQLHLADEHDLRPGRRGASPGSSPT